MFLRIGLILILFFPIQVVVAEETRFHTKIAVVDVESILEHSLAIACIKKSVQKITTEIQDQLSLEESKLRKIETELVEKRGILSEKEFKQSLDSFNSSVSAVQQLAQRKKIALEKAHAEAIAEVHDHTIAVIRDLSKNNRFNIVLPSTQVLFVDNSLNITLEVISNLNDSVKHVEVKYTPDT